MEFLKLLAETFPRFVPAVWVTVKITVLGLLLAMPLGLISCFMKISKIKILEVVSDCFVWIIRSTPMIVQAFFLYLGLPQLTGGKIDVTVASVIVIMVNAGAYLSEIFRSGIQSIDKGQMEAARSLGMGVSMSMFYIILPQAIRVVIPSVVNQFIISFKDTSILSVIGLSEIVKKGKEIIAYNYLSFQMWIIVAIYYVIIVSLLTLGARWVEQKLKPKESTEKA
ncbi:MAG: amino acid ABC transporter permease [Clostridia bacterium]|nr:amino acid ABC transporter permease [Clostridia bacterium]MBQ4543186.1 amino acid ABC transporter permease [Clostridia bacterium]